MLRGDWFDQMQQTEFRGLEDVKECRKFFRKGEIGSWNEYTVAWSEAFGCLRINQRASQQVGESGLEFWFE